MTETTLDWIDAALDADAPTTSDPVGREVQELALALRAESPEPHPEFADWLEDRVEARFPRRRAVRMPRPRTLALGGALAAAAMGAIVAVVVSTGGQSPAPTVATHSAPPPQLPNQSTSRDLQKNARSAAPVEPSETGPASRGFAFLMAPDLDPENRRVARSAEVTLAAPEKRLREVADGVVAVTGRHHGFVQHEDISTGVPQAGGELDLRVPVGELDATLRDLSGVADVRARTERADDLTRRYAALSAKLAESRVLMSGHLYRRANAPTPAERGRLRQALRIDDARARRLSSELRALNQETNFSQVAVTLQVDRHGAVTGSSTKRALDDAADTFVDVFDASIRALGVLVPLGLVAAALAFAARVLRRRRREAVLA